MSTLRNLLCPVLLEVFAESVRDDELSESWQKAKIVALPKDGRDLTYPQLCRPISLLNVEYKILVTILSTRLRRILDQYIHPDQSGFLCARELRNNVRRVCNLINYVQSTDTPSLLFFCDADKAFDTIQWNFLITILQNMEMGLDFVSWIKRIYMRQTAEVSLEGHSFPTITLHRGVRQECPLSPLLFEFEIEILEIKGRNRVEIEGTCLLAIEHKTMLFTDDVVFTVHNPEMLLRALHTTLTEFGEISGYKVNTLKSVLMGINIPTDGEKPDQNV